MPFLMQNKRAEDEIVVLFDSKNGDNEVLDYSFEDLSHDFLERVWIQYKDWK